MIEESPSYRYKMGYILIRIAQVMTSKVKVSTFNSNCLLIVIMIKKIVALKIEA